MANTASPYRSGRGSGGGAHWRDRTSRAYNDQRSWRISLSLGNRSPLDCPLSSSRRGDFVIYRLGLTVFLFAFWLFLSGYFEPFLITAGIGSAVAIVLFTRRMKEIDAEGHPLSVRALVYGPWLAKEVLTSALAVSRIILTPNLPISPTLVRFKPSQRTIAGLVAHANSITLTPGTITIHAEAGGFLVHGLTRANADGCIDSEMDRRVSHFERRT